MFAFIEDAEVFVHREPVDFRKQINGLTVLVQESMELDVMREALVRTTGQEGLLDLPTALHRLVREGALAPDAARQMLRAMRDGVPLRRVRHDARPGPADRRPDARRPVPQGSDPTRTRPPG